MKKVIYILVAWFLLEWVYTTKLKPFIVSEFPHLIIPVGKDSIPASDAAAADKSKPPFRYDSITGMNSGKYVYGLDISHYQTSTEVITALHKHRDSLSYIFCKTSDGLSPDPLFKANWDLVKAKPELKRGTYHFFRQHISAVQQANYYCNMLKSVGYSSSDLPPVIDFEVNHKPHPSNSTSLNSSRNIHNAQDSIYVFLSIVEKTLQRRPLIYMNVSTAERIINVPLSGYFLWIAEYKTPPVHPNFPGHPNYWAFWQKTDKYAPARGDKLDLDVFNGDATALNTFILNSNRKEQ